jgi:hypothetical protein
MPRYVLPVAASLVVLAAGGYTMMTGPKSWFSGTAPKVETVPIDTPAAAPPTAPKVATKKADKPGVISVTAPAGAHVILDGKPRGTAPVELNGITPGSHTLELESASGTVKRTIIVRPGGRFVADENIGPGYLSIVSKNPLEIYSGGKRIGTTDEDKIEMTPGTHTVTLLNPKTGGRSELTVEIKAGEVSAYTNKPATGRLVVDTAAGAEVFIDGESVGTAPLAALEVAVGERTIVVRHPELGEKRVTMEIKRDQRTEITLPFATTATDPQRPAPKLAPLSAAPAPRPTIR